MSQGPAGCPGASVAIPRGLCYDGKNSCREDGFMDLCNPKEIKALLGRHGFHFSKSHGAEFPHPILGAPAGGGGLRRGPRGAGCWRSAPASAPSPRSWPSGRRRWRRWSWTRALLPILAETMAPYPNVEIVPGDVMKLDLACLAAGSSSPACRPWCAPTCPITSPPR